MSEWDSWIGKSVVQKDRLTPALLHRFRATIDSMATGRVAEQATHWALCTPEAATAWLGVDGHPARTGYAESFFPPIPLPRRMWAASKIEFLAPIAVDAQISRTSTIAEIAQKEGSTGKLVFVDITHQTSADDVVALIETQTLVHREATTAAPTPAPPDAEPDFSLWHFHRTITPDAALLFRFSAMTFNSHRIHYDAPYAVNEEGYRALVVHGPLLATLLLDLAGRELGHNRLTRFNFRAQSAAFVNEPLHLVGRRNGDGVELAALGGDGRVCVLADGAVSRMMTLP